MNTQEYHSNGKLLLTGEYLVLKGAKALALPLKYGQDISISPLQKSKEILWRTYVKNRLWFEAKFDQELNILDSTINLVARKLQKILKASLRLNGLNAQAISGNQVTTYIQFDIEWGLGSSSSLLSNIAYWLDISPYQLQFETSNGSGYDIAAARSEKPIVYSLANNTPEIQKSSFNPPFKDQLYFVYLGKKQRSEESVASFETKNIGEGDIERISEITEAAQNTKSLDSFVILLSEHNDILASILDQQPPGELLFQDFDGFIKPLGAWGGDFVLAASEKPSSNVKDYFYEKGYNTVFTYKELVK